MASGFVAIAMRRSAGDGGTHRHPLPVGGTGTRCRGRPVDAGGRPMTAPLAPRLPASAMAELRQAMDRDASVVRDADGLERLIRRLDRLSAAHGCALPLVAARLVADAALARRESRGGHYRRDAVEAAEPRRTFVTLGEARTCQAA